jgi:hypothetical protein
MHIEIIFEGQAMISCKSNISEGVLGKGGIRERNNGEGR